MGVSILLLRVQFHNLFNFALPPAAATLPPHNISNHCLPIFLPCASTSDCGAAWSARSLKMKSYTVTPPKDSCSAKSALKAAACCAVWMLRPAEVRDMDITMQLQVGGSQ